MMHFLSSVFIRLLLNTAIVWAMSNYIGQYFVMTQTWSAYLVVGAIVTVLNVLVRPILAILTWPLKMIATLLAVIVVNGVFIQLTVTFVKNIAPSVEVAVEGDLWGWVVCATALGTGNWLMKHLVRH